MTKPFVDVFNQLRYGKTAEEMTEATRQMVDRVTALNKPGKITLTIDFKPGKSGQVELSDDIKIALPKEERASTLMFATPENNLTRDDPKQQRLNGIRAVDDVEKELRQAPEAAPREVRSIG